MPERIQDRALPENKLNPARQNEFIQDALKKSLKEHFPVVGNYHTLELVGEPHIDDNVDDHDLPAQKEIKLIGKSWQVPVYGTFRLRDNKTGMVIDEAKKVKIANIPKLTDRFSMIIGGNEYTTINQFRLKSGVYTRRKANGEMESFFNLAVGFNFKMELDPADGVFYLFVNKQRFHLYTLLHALSVSDTEMGKAWGQELLDKNRGAGVNEGDREIPLLWEKLRRQKTGYGEALENVKKYLDDTRMDASVTKVTIGEAHDRVNPTALLDTSKKLLGVMRGEQEEDERDSLLYKQLYTVDEQLDQYFKKAAVNIAKNLKYRTDNKAAIREIVSSDTYTGPIQKFFTTGDLSNPSPQTNPVEMASEWRKTTVTGSGGIQSEHAITFKTRDVHPSQFGFVDPLHTPEGSKVGVTVSLGVNVRKKGNDLTTTIVTPGGKEKDVTPQEFYDMKIGFPDQHDGHGKAIGDLARIMWKGKVDEIDSNEVDAYLLDPASMFGWSTNLIPFLGNNSGNRAAVAAKMASQAVGLKEPESPLVKVQMRSGDTMDTVMGQIITTRLPRDITSGEVTDIDKDYITVKDSEGKKRKIGLYNDFPLNQESFLNSIPTVKVGDKVKHGQLLARNNFTDSDSNYAYGANATVAYMPWYGYNFEDGIVVTESMAKKLTSPVILKKSLSISGDGIMDKKKFTSYFPEIITQSNLAKLDDTGVIKEGEKVQPGEVLIAYLQKVELNDTEKIMKQMNRIISNPYRNRALMWDGDHEGTIKYVRGSNGTVNVWIYEEQPLVVGDKLAARYGDKGIVTKIITDNEAPYTKDGTRIDILFNPHGVVGRMNMGQMLETAAGKLAMKTGTPYVVKNFSGKNYLADIKQQLKKNKIPVDEQLFTKDGKPLTSAPVFWGVKYYLKLMHVVDHKFKARGIPGSYDANEQPAKGDEGGQSIDPLQTYALLAHGARENLYEFAAVKSQKNDEYWRNLQLGFPPPKPQKNFVFDKMMNYMQAAGVNVKKDGYKMTLYPATSKDIMKISSGEIKDAGHMLRGKDLMELEGGLFDPKLTGGLRGTNWNHMILNESMPNPLFQPAIQSLIGVNGKQFENLMNEELVIDGLTGAKYVKKQLAGLDVNAEYKKAVADLKKAPTSQVNQLNKKVRYLKVLKDFKLDPVDAYMMKAVPILPPLFRPIYPLPSGDLQVSPINKHYRDISLVNNQIKEIKKLGVDDAQFNKVNRVALYSTLKSLIGLTDPMTYTQEKYEGLIKTLSGEQPKEGFVQNKVWGRRQDLSARSTVTVEPSVGLDQVGLPEPMIRTIMKPFVIRELVRQGYKPIDAIKQYKEWTPMADQALNVVIEERPVLMNRAPSLHKHNVQALYPIRFDGMSIRVNPLIIKGLNMDFDGDTASIHVPVSEAAVVEARGMVPSKNLYKAGDKDQMSGLSQDYQLGVYFLTVAGKDTRKTFANAQDAMKAGLGYQDQFTMKGKKVTLGRILVNGGLPSELRDYNIEFNGKHVKKLIDKLYKDHPLKFADALDHLKNVGRQYAVERGSTLSLDDIAIDRTYRDDILAKYEKKFTAKTTPDEKIMAYMKAKDEILKKQDELYAGSGNRFYDMLRSGSSSKAGQIAQILSMPGIVEDVHGHPIAIPIKKSWAEGVDSFDYWNQSYGARKGVVDKSINTQEAGGLNKELLFNTKNLLVVEEECGTPDGISVAIDSREVLDRYLASDVPGVGKRNDLVDSELLAKAKKRKIETLLVRSPLECESEGGICVKCYGLMPNGQPPRVGENVGVLDAEAITERSTQLTLQTFHSGGVAGTKSGILAGFPRLKELLYVPATIVDKAVLAEEAGLVKSIVANPAGGHDLYIGDKRYYIPRERTINVNVGQTVKRGDTLTDGSIKAQELSALKDHQTAQIYTAKEINKIYDDKFARKSIETVIRGTSNFAEINELPDGAPVTWLRGDTVPLTSIKKVNRQLSSEGGSLIKFTPVFKSIDVLPLEEQDWLSRLTTNRLKQTIQEAVTTGMTTDTKGTDPMPGYLSAVNFGQNLNLNKKQLY